MTALQVLQVRRISISQFGAAGWLDMRPDGLHTTKMVSAMFLTAIQRRHGLYLSVIAPTVEVPEPAMTVIVPLVLTSCERATFPMAV